MSDYQPELGQACFGNPAGEYGLSEIGHASVTYLLDVMRIARWNIDQKEWQYRGGVGQIEVRPYWWGDDEAPEASLPNLAFKGVEIRWYKYPGRGMSCNMGLRPDQWSDWLVEALAEVRRVENEHGPMP